MKVLYAEYSLYRALSCAYLSKYSTYDIALYFTNSESVIAMIGVWRVLTYFADTDVDMPHYSHRALEGHVSDGLTYNMHRIDCRIEINLLSTISTT